jgi:hypothetical protein
VSFFELIGHLYDVFSGNNSSGGLSPALKKRIKDCDFTYAECEAATTTTTSTTSSDESMNSNSPSESPNQMPEESNDYEVGGVEDDDEVEDPMP